MTTLMKDDRFSFRYRISKVETFISNILIKLKFRSKYLEDREVRDSFGVLLIIICFVIGFVLFFYNFYTFVTINYEEEFFDVLRLSITPIFFLILPLFIPSILNSFQFGYCPGLMRKKYEMNKKELLRNMTKEEFDEVIDATKNSKLIKTLKGNFKFYIFWISAILIFIMLLISVFETNSYYIFNSSFEAIVWYIIGLFVIFLIAVGIRHDKSKKGKNPTDNQK
jgi:hypothetical protein